MESTYILKSFPFLKKPELEKEILENATIKVATKGEVIVREGQYINMLPLVISGSIRVFQQSEDREILLYYVNAGETCMMSLTACFFENISQSQAIAEELTEIIYVPTKFVSIWQRKYSEWNEFTIKTFKNRYDELLNSFNSVVFKNIEERLENYLVEYSKTHNTKLVEITHMALSNELGTTRVVTSRLLKRLEENGKLKLLRGGIQLL